MTLKIDYFCKDMESFDDFHIGASVTVESIEDARENDQPFLPSSVPRSFWSRTNDTASGP
jgi:hypothetical protein